MLHTESDVDTANASRGPQLVISGTADHPARVTTRATFKQYRYSPAVTELRQFEWRGHSLTTDSGWRDVADTSLAWLRDKGL